MNNEQFRRLVLDKPGQKKADKNSNADSPPSQQSPSGGLLGSRLRASIPMTPRSVRGSSNNNNVDFARQLAEQRREEMGPPPTKKFKSSMAPKGTKLASGYQDRTALRRLQEDQEQEGDRHEDAEDTEDDVGTRLRALEEVVKLGQIDHATFEKLRREIGVGGDLGSTHLVKGLDWDLLKRVKAGEDVEKRKKKEKDEQDKEEIGDIDEELDRVLEQKDGQMPAPKEKKVKKGNLAMPPPLLSVRGSKMSRDEILQRLKASRAAAASTPEAAPPESTLGTKFKKIRDEDKPEKKRWVETDSNGRRKEILVTTDAEGKTKRKVRWLDKEAPAKADTIDSNGLMLPNQDAQPLGMEVPAVIAAKMAAEANAAAEAEDDDIFAGVGTDYNPLGDLDEDDSEDDEEKEEEKALENKPVGEGLRVESSAEAPGHHQQQQKVQRNYFNDKKTDEETDTRTNPLTNDPTLLAALKRAANLRQNSPSGRAEEELGDDADTDPERLARRKKFFEEARRRDAQDALDLDYGFGSSRVEDEEDEEGPTFDASGDKRGGSNKRKRGPKKRKGDKDSATDVLQVMEGRKKG